MKRLNEVLRADYEKLTLEDWDKVLLITGDEGISKSNLGLTCIDTWNGWLIDDDIKKTRDPKKDIKYVALSITQFLEALKDVKKFGCVIYDEAGEISSLRMMNKFNYKLTKTYEVIRGENLFTILILPDVFYLNPFFSSRRARGLIHVYKRGKFAYWNKRQLRRMIEINKTYKTKNPFRVKPLFFDTFPKYKGYLKNAYADKKREKMHAAREELYEEIVKNDDPKLELKKVAYNLRHKITDALNVKVIAEAFNVTDRTIYNWLKEMENMN